MKILSIDIETLGLNPAKHNIIEFGCIIEDSGRKLPFSDLPKCRYYFDHGDEYTGDPFAINMNQDILKKIIELRKDDPNHELIKPDEFFDRFLKFLLKHLGVNGKLPRGINVAGKNYTGFDKRFLEKLKYFTRIPFSHRVIDPGSMYIDWDKDNGVPNLQTCNDRAGIEHKVSHTTLEDCYDVICLLRKFY